MDTTDEKYPLLLLGSEDSSGKGGRKMEFKKKTRFISNATRNKNILQGATTIITQWPGRWTACWATTLCLGIVIVLMTIVISVSLEDLHREQTKLKCPKEKPSHFSNKTVHIVHDSDHWNQNELEILQYIIETYKNYSVHISIFQKDENNRQNREVSTTIKEKQQETKETEIKMADTTSILTTTDGKISNESSLLLYDGPLQSFDPFSLFEKLRNLKPFKRTLRETENEKSKPKVEEKLLTFEGVINGSDVFVDHFIYKEYFKNTPLRYEWVNLDPELLIFACRIQELWQHSGISFIIPQFKNNDVILTTNESAILSKNSVIFPNTTNLNISIKNPSSENITTTISPINEKIALKSLILTSKSVFENLSPDLVIIDRKGYHIGSKIPCHAFFGELLTKVDTLNHISIRTLVEEMLQDFCKRGAVNIEDCKMI